MPFFSSSSRAKKISLIQLPTFLWHSNSLVRTAWPIYPVGMHMVASHHCLNRRSPQPVCSLYFCEVGQLSVMHCLSLALELTEENKHSFGVVRLSKVLKFFSNRGHLQVEWSLIQFQPARPQKLHHVKFSYYSLASCSAWT